MATPKSQRIGIGIIAFVMILGTLGSFLVMALSVQNSSIDAANYQKEYEEQYAEQLEQQKLASQMNADISEPLSGYSARTFAAEEVNDLSVEVLKQGNGETVELTDTVKCSYFGWISDGTIFDSSKKTDSDDAPVEFSLSGVISGWTEGLEGQKTGSVVRLTIPSDKAYGATGSGIIPADAPLEFIVEILSTTKA